MRVLVGIEVGDRNSALLKSADLGYGLGFDLFRGKFARQRTCGEPAQVTVKVDSAMSIAVEKCGHLGWIEHRFSIHQHQVAPDA